MGLILYECSAEFPKQIPDILSAEGLAVTADGKRPPKIKKTKNDFAYTISDGGCRINLTGGEEDDGFVCFFLFSHWSWNPKVILKKRAFYRRVSSPLLKAGAKVWQPEKKEPNQTPEPTAPSGRGSS